jgi:hypothetical protein
VRQWGVDAVCRARYFFVFDLHFMVLFSFLWQMRPFSTLSTQVPVDFFYHLPHPPQRPPSSMT